MVVHIVMFEFKSENKKVNIQKATTMLQGLLKSVPSLLSIEVGQNFNDSQRAMDLSIITTFENLQGLESYAVHPEHLKVVEFIKETTNRSQVVDYIK